MVDPLAHDPAAGGLQRAGSKRLSKQGIGKAGKDASQKGRPRGTSPEQAELAEARERIARLERTIAEQAMQLHLIEGKDGWD